MIGLNLPLNGDMFMMIKLMANGSDIMGTVPGV